MGLIDRSEEKVIFFEKILQKNLEVKKKVVPLQPVWEKNGSSLTSLRKDNEVKLEDEIKKSVTK